VLLTAALNDKDEKVREVAEAGLAQLHLSHEKAIHLCLKQLKDSCYAETALRNSGQLAVSALIKALGTKDSGTREKAARTLGCLGESAAEAIPALTLALHDKDLDVRLAAAKGLWNITKNAEVVVPVLVGLLEENGAVASDAGELRRRYLQTVIEALWRMGPAAKGAIPALIEAGLHDLKLPCSPCESEILREQRNGARRWPTLRRGVRAASRSARKNNSVLPELTN
jgi:HEAT repeat protein